MGRSKKRFKGVCCKKRSADSDVENESDKQKPPDGEPSNVKDKKKSQNLSKESELKKLIDLDLHMSKAVSDMLDKLDRMDMLNMEIINKFVGMLDVDYNSKVVRLVGERKDDLRGPKGFIKQPEYDDDMIVRQVSIEPGSVKDKLGFSESQIGQEDNVRHCVRNNILAMHPKERLTMSNVQRGDNISVTHDFPGEKPACCVDGSPKAIDTLAKSSLREVGTPIDDTHASAVPTYSGPDTPFTRENIYKCVRSKGDNKEGKRTPHLVTTPVKMISIKCDAEYLVGSRNSPKPVLVDNSVQVSETPPSQKEMKSMAVNTEEVTNSTKAHQPFSGLFDPTKLWNMTPFDVYCKRISMPKPALLRDGDSPYRNLFTRSASKSRLSKFNLKIPKTWQNKQAKDLSTNREGEQLSEKGKTDTISVDFEIAAPLAFGPKPKPHITKSTHTCEFGKQSVETMDVPQLGMICRKMFFDDIPQASNQDKSDAGSNKLSLFTIAYINAAQQRLKTSVHQFRKGSMMVMPLKEMCCQLLGIRCHINYSDITCIKQDYKLVDDKDGFRPESSNGDMDVIDKHQVKTTHIPQLRMICRKMFFDDIPHASNVDEYVADSYKLSSLAMAYINAAHQRLLEGTHHVSDGNMMVLPLREICRQLFGIGRLTVKGQFGAAPTSAEKMKSHQMKELNYADSAIASQIECQRTVGMELPSVERLISTPIGTMSLRYLMEIYQNSGTFKEAHAQFLCYNLLEGLKFLHRKGIAHKFIFPRRIMFNSNGYPSLMSNAEIVGPKIRPRIEFSSPEQITTGSTTIATDIFQVGLVVYAMVYGRSPFKADTYTETKENLLNEDFTPDFESVKMSSHGRYFIRKCLRTDPELRFKVIKSEKTLENAVKWFNLYKGEDLANQNYDSPFKNLIELKAYMDVMLDQR